ncbi:LysR family transcriptional regulator (plasmid) [Skermanella rosea]|uniref:LysR family transcriptional regulator n=1 Tax=Skermanella rosea TaxID=1817965 RepID=UPI0019312C37|nr:LysR family transcriptional regulator [Skermanella rosea]UEM07489.1 LysR family transcriptional regulator [Skermanella rosea]
MRIWRYVDEAAKFGSLRKAAEQLNVTPSALQRRIQDVEEDLGAAIFERSAHGIRLTAAGESFIRWVRTQSADLERVRSHIEDLSGMRRGHVRIACSQALVNYFLPRQISEFRQSFPLVSFQVSVVDQGSAIRMLREYETDLAIIFSPRRTPEFQPLMTLGQRVVAIVAADHPLAGHKVVRLRDCAQYPIALPDGSFGTRAILEDLLSVSSAKLSVELESNSFEMLRNLARSGRVVTFQIEIGAPVPETDPGLVALPLSDLDMAHGPLVLGQQRGRTLPVATAKFAEQLARRLDDARMKPQPEQ